MRIYFDGECRPSEWGNLRTCIVAIHGDDAHVEDLPAGKGRSMDAEWQALFHAVRYAIAHEIEKVEFVGDSLSVIEAAENRGVKSNPYMSDMCRQFNELVADAPIQFRFEHVRRHLSLAGRYLEEGNSASFRWGLNTLEGVVDVRIG